MRLVLPLFAIGLLFIGAGCADTKEATPYTSSTKSAGTAVETNPAPESEDAVTTGDLTLSADARGAQSVYFEWKVPADTEYDNYILVRSEEADPVHDEVNYWFRQHYTRRAVSWLDQPVGTWHFRMCGVLNDECSVYSNTVEVVVR